MEIQLPLFDVVYNCLSKVSEYIMTMSSPKASDERR